MPYCRKGNIGDFYTQFAIKMWLNTRLPIRFCIGIIFGLGRMYFFYFILKIFGMLKMIRQSYVRITIALMLSFVSLLSFAQDKGLDVDINVKKDNEWYQQPWMWVIGGAIFILLLVALLRSGSAKKG